jgi:hypothetical protein
MKVTGMLIQFSLIAMVLVVSPNCGPVPNEQSTLKQLNSIMNPENNHASVTGYVYVKTGSDKREPLVDALVYLMATNAIELKSDLEHVTAKIKDGRLIPEFICLVVGQKLRIEVDDKDPYLLHFSSPQEPESGRVLPRDITRWERAFTKPVDSVLVTCDIHPQFKGYVTVVPDSVFARTNKDGSFRLPHALPAGKYEVSSYHPQYGRARSSVEIRPSDMSVSTELLHVAK